MLSDEEWEKTLDQADDALSNEEYDKAYNLLIKLSEHDNDNGHIYSKAGYAQEQLKNYDEAKSLYLKGAEAGDSLCYTWLGLLVEEVDKDLNKAREYLDKAILHDDAEIFAAEERVQFELRNNYDNAENLCKELNKKFNLDFDEIKQERVVRIIKKNKITKG